MLCCVACSTKSPYISQREKQQLLAKLERKIDDKLGGPYGEMVLKLNLLEENPPLIPCQRTSDFASLNSTTMTRDAYIEKMTEIEKKLDNQNPLLPKIYYTAEQRAGKLKNLVKFAKLQPQDFQGNGHTLGWEGVAHAMGGPFVAVGNDDANILDNFTAISNTEALSQQLNTLNRLNTLIEALPLANPLPEGVQTSGFTIRRDPINGRLAKHEGLDLVGKENAEIYSAAPGVVSFAGRSSTYGNMVIINHGLGITTRYAHLKLFSVQKGASVTANQLIGIQGNTGRTTGAHLHYEVRFNERPHNPDVFLKLSTSCASSL